MDEIQLSLVCSDDQNRVTVDESDAGGIGGVFELDTAEENDFFVVVDVDEVDVGCCDEDVVVDGEFDDMDLFFVPVTVNNGP